MEEVMVILEFDPQRKWREMLNRHSH